MAQLSVDFSFVGGLVPAFYTNRGDYVPNPENAILGANNQCADGIFNPTIRPGFLAPANQEFTNHAPDNAFVGNPRGFAYDSLNSELILFENDKQVFYSSGAGFTDKGDLDSGVPTGTDVALYQVNGVPTAFIGYQNAGGGDLWKATLPISSATAVQTWFSGTTSGGAALSNSRDVHLEVADDGFMYIGNENVIHRLDGSTAGGANGTAYLNRIIFDASLLITDMHSTGGFLYVAIRDDGAAPRSLTAANGRRCGIYIWDKRTTVASTESYIPLEGAATVLKITSTDEGVPVIFVKTTDNNLQIRKFNGITFKLVRELSINSAPLYKGSVSTVGSMIEWVGGVDGIFYSFGVPYEGAKESLYKIGKTPGTVVSAHAYFAYNKKRFVGHNDGALKVDSWEPLATGAGVNPYQGDIYTKQFYLPPKSTVKELTIYCQVTGTGATTIATLKMYKNGSTSAFKTEAITATDASRGYVYIPINQQNINQIQFEIEYPTADLINDDAFYPSAGLLEYELTKTRG